MYMSLFFLTILIQSISVFCQHGQRDIYDNAHWTPWDRYDPSVVVRTQYGDVRGRTIPWHKDDLDWNKDFNDKPVWFLRRINCFLGIPYAEPPIGRYRFQRPERPRWGGTLNVKNFKPACPQPLEPLLKDLPNFNNSRISEDCLYLNIFAPNVTAERGTLYPVMVFIHGGEFTSGTAEMYPGHVLATHRIVVVTFNYRLGALGFLSSGDQHAAGNWGLWDQNLALEFVKENIKAFYGDPDKITIAGEGAGAASVGLHMVSPVSRKKNLYFNQAILMGGSDLSEIAYTRPFWQPHEYAKELANFLGCDTVDTYELVECMRNEKISWQSIVEMQQKVKPNNGKIGFVWNPVQDGGYYFGTVRMQEFLPETPHDLRRQLVFSKIPVLVGINAQEGSKKSGHLLDNICDGLHPQSFETFIRESIIDWNIHELYRERVFQAINFQYTHWQDSENVTERAIQFQNMISDYDIGSGLDTVIKQHAQFAESYFYVFEYDSWNEPHSNCEGESLGALPYVFGVPFMDETKLNETAMVARQIYNYDDRNISLFMSSMISNFTAFGKPTPTMMRNITWEPFTLLNRTYLSVNYFPYLWYDYRQTKYGFWREYLPMIVLQDYYYPTATPTPGGYVYVYSSWGMGSFLFIILFILGVCICLLCLQHKREQIAEAYADSTVPFTFTAPSIPSQSSLSVHTKKSVLNTPNTSIHHSDYTGQSLNDSRYDYSAYSNQSRQYPNYSNYHASEV